MALPITIICEIDDTLYNDDNNCNIAVKRIIHDFYYSSLNALQEKQIMFITQRKNDKREETNEWLKKHLSFLKPEHYSLYMVAENDTRDNTTIKEQIYNVAIKNRWNVIYAIDNIDFVCWKNLGLTCILVK